MLTITALMENTTYVQDIRAQHGLSLCIETKEGCILFDSGPSAEVTHNAGILKKDISAARAVVLSHGHYDHTGGLEAVLGRNTNAPVYLKTEGLNPKSDPSGRDIGIPQGCRKALEGRIHPVTGLREILPQVFIVSEIPILHPEDTHFAGLLTTVGGSIIQDTFPEELFLAIKDDEGMHIITGCSHRGIVNIIEAAGKLFNLPIRTVLGGFHLKKEPKERVSRLAQGLAALSEKARFGVCHCTGIEAYACLRSELEERAFYFSAGMSISL